MSKLNDSILHLTFNEPPLPVDTGMLQDFVPAIPRMIEDRDFGYCAEFNGKTHYLQKQIADLNPANNSFSVTLWFQVELGTMDKAGEKGEQVLLRCESASGDDFQETLLSLRDGKLRVGTAAESLTGSMDLQAQQWYHLTWTYDATNKTQSLFVDGIPDGEAIISSLSLQNSLRLGSAVGEKFFCGNMSQMRMYNFALTQTQINQLLLQDKTSLILHAPLDEVSNNNENGSLFFADQSGNDILVSSNGTHKVVPDANFGTCTHFSGSTVEHAMVSSEVLHEAMEFTISVWIYPTAKSEHQGIFQNRIDDTKENFNGLYFTGNRPSLPVALRINNQEFQAAENSAPLDQWTHVSAVWKSDDEVCIYINGVLSKNSSFYPETIPVGPLSVSNSWSLGHVPGFDDKRSFQGKMAHLRVYQRALNEVQINHIKQNDFVGLNVNIDGAAITADHRIQDLSGHGRMAKITGAPKVNNDRIFGSCLAFDGSEDNLELVDTASTELTNRSFTVETCFQADLESELDQAILSSDNAEENQGLQLLIKDYKIYVAYADVKLFGIRILKPGQWYHLVFCYDKFAREARLYIDGVLDVAVGDAEPLNSSNTLRVGRLNESTLFKGSLAFLRIYNRSLNIDHIQKRLREGQTSRGAFQQLNPIWFNIYDEGIENCLFINDRDQYWDPEFLLEIGNNLSRNLTLKPALGGEVGPANHHFELRFRPGVLDEIPDLEGKTSLDKVLLGSPESADWTFKIVRSQASGVEKGSVSLFLLRNLSAALELEPAAKISLRIQGLALDHRGGSRGTRLELNYDNISYPSMSKLSGSREIQLNVVNRRGEKSAPLHVGFFGDNRVINDGSANELTLHVTSTDLNNPIALSPENAVVPTSFTLFFESKLVDENQNWALGTSDEVKSITLSVEDGWSCKKTIMAQGPLWTIGIIDNDKTELKPNEVVIITIKNIVSSLPSGITNLILKTRNLPNYRDNEFIIPIEKSPMVIRDQNVGIGTTNPLAKLHVNGNIAKIGGHYATTTLRIEATDDSYRPATTVKLELHGYHDRAKGIYLSNETTLEKPITDKWFIGKGYGYDGFGVGYSSNGEKTEYKENSKFFVGKNGNVGVGTTNPVSKLHIHGDYHNNGTGGFTLDASDNANPETYVLRINPFALGDSKVGYQFQTKSHAGGVNVPLTFDNTGNVGIGTTRPVEKLHVKGGKIKLDGGSGTYLTVTETGSNAESRFWTHIDGKLYVQNSNGIEFAGISNSSRYMSILSNGNVGIGTTNPTKAKLEINQGGQGIPVGAHGYFFKGGATTGWTATWYNNSIYAIGNILAREYIAFSDERIKRVEGRSDTALDLAVLLDIEVTDYSYIDTVKGMGKHKKVIAQQVEKVYPQAVTKSTDVVPDIYQQASVKDGWVELATNLKKGERVKLISEQAEAVHEVLEVSTDRFRTNFKPDGKKVFVYGSEVNDFGSVDYNAIAMLNVSATQELARQLEIKDAKITVLKKQLAEQTARFTRLEKEVRSLVKSQELN